MQLKKVEIKYNIELTESEMKLLNKAVALVAGMPVSMRTEEKTQLVELNSILLEMRKSAAQRQLQSYTNAIKNAEELEC